MKKIRIFLAVLTAVIGIGGAFANSAKDHRLIQLYKDQNAQFPVTPGYSCTTGVANCTYDINGHVFQTGVYNSPR